MEWLKKKKKLHPISDMAKLVLAVWLKTLFTWKTCDVTWSSCRLKQSSLFLRWHFSNATDGGSQQLQSFQSRQPEYLIWVHWATAFLSVVRDDLIAGDCLNISLVSPASAEPASWRHTHSPGSRSSLPHIHPVPLPHRAHQKHSERCLGQPEHKAAIEAESQWIPLYTIRSDSRARSTWVFLKVNSWSLYLRHRTQKCWYFFHEWICWSWYSFFIFFLNKVTVYWRFYVSLVWAERFVKSLKKYQFGWYIIALTLSFWKYLVSAAGLEMLPMLINCCELYYQAWNVSWWC